MATVASAQPLRPMELQAVEAGIEDVDPLARGGRMQPRDLRYPLGFERVYRVPGRPDLYMRIDSGLVAIFPRSVYVPTAWGQMPVVPPGTRFYPGGLPAELRGRSEVWVHKPPPVAPAERAGAAHAGPALYRDEVVMRVEPTEGSFEQPDDRTGLWSNEPFRQSRISTLLRAAGDDRTFDVPGR
ncbi:MAG: hypothetical protein KF866_11945 [Phycisphaeraceae bacterium]|nr:hypothetical protein [Phycisphaeraceae bacterium]MCW5755247.1 hypothetical protein [Phycisphaeraceae bacterium]